MTNCRLDWCIRENYLELLKEFEEGRITTFEFCSAFQNIGNLTSDIIDIFELNFVILSPTEKALKFSDLLDEIFDLCLDYFQESEFFNNDPNQNPQEFQKYKTEFKNSIQEIHLKIFEFLNKE